MSEPPTTLLLSRLGERARSELADELRNRLPDADVRVADSEADDERHLDAAEVVVTSDFDAATLDRAPQLRWVQATSAGVDHYDRDAFRAAGVALTTASGVHAEPIGEQVLGYLLVFERNIHRGVRQQVDRDWSPYSGTELAGKTVGVVGVGAIGTRVAELCGAVGTTVLGVKRDPSTAPEPVDEAFGPDDLDEVLSRSDYVVLACPLTDETRGLIDADALAAMPESAVLVNIARGGVVDEAALVAALRDGTIAGAALDVFEEEPLPEDSPLWGMENVVVTPHVAGTNPTYWERTAAVFADNYRRYVAGDPLRNAVVEVADRR